MLSFPVPVESAGLRLDRFVQQRIPRLSRTRAQAIVQACAYTSDGRLRRASERVRTGEVVIIVRPSFDEPTDVPRTFDVLYEDDDMMVIDKPAGLPVHPSATYHKGTLTYLMRERFSERTPHIAHRLDRETSGIIVCSRTDDAERKLKNAFEERRVQKRYVAIVHGRLPQEEGEIVMPMRRATEGLHVLMEVDHSNGAEAVTHYRVLDTTDAHSLVLLKPHTGRQHQLRVHLSQLGNSIVGDKLYGPNGVAPFEEYIATGMTTDLRQRLGHTRHALHAFEVDIAHPTSGATMTFRAPFAHDLRPIWGGTLPPEVA